MKFCPECGAKLENETVKFCPECGKRISTSEKTEVKNATNPLMEEYEYEGMPDGTYAIIKPKDKYKTKYVIPEGVTVIRENAFSCVQIIEEVVLPDGIKIIEKEAFSVLPTLKKINFPQSLYAIGSRAFAGTKLQVVEVTNNLKHWEGAFDSCIVEKVIFDKSVKVIPDFAFWKAKIGNIVFHEGLEVVGKNAFFEATLPEKIELPRTLNVIGESAFDSKGVYEIIYSGKVSPELGKDIFFRGKVISTAEISKQESVKKEKTVSENNSRKSRGIVAYAGRVDGKDNNGEDCKIEKKAR